MGIKKWVSGLALIFLSIIILLIFIVSFYNILFGGGKFAFFENIITIPILIGLMIFSFKTGIKILRNKNKKTKTNKKITLEWHTLLGVSFSFLGISILFGLIKIIIMTNAGIYQKLSLLLPLFFLTLGCYWISDGIKKEYINTDFFKERIIFFKNDFKKSFMSGFGYILGIFFLLYFAFSPLITNIALTPLEKIIDFMGTLNIVFHSIWVVFFFYGRK